MNEAVLVNNPDGAISIMIEAGQWLLDNNKPVSKWWDLENLNKEFLYQYAKPEEFYTLNIDNEPIAGVILQVEQNAQDWADIDDGRDTTAMYIHWLCVKREHAGRGIPMKVINAAASLALEQNIHILRADTNAEETNLRKVYEDIGFVLLGVQDEGYRTTAFYQKEID